MHPAALSLPSWMAAQQHQVEQALLRVLPSEQKHPQRFHAAMRYAVLNGGKRVRPLLVYAAGELSHASAEVLDVAACAVELIHSYSLVHDDLPCMDNDVLRRGKPTCHIAFDEATALLAGDALQTLAFEILCQPLPSLTANTQLLLLKELSHASGAGGMAGGQAIDLAAVGKQLNQAELEQMHCLKTGALIRAALLLGAHAGQVEAEQIAALERFAGRMGLAFQVVDDILDCEADSQTLGKTAGKDAAQDKPTYVSIMGLAAAKAFAADLHQDARAALTPFGDDAKRLLQLADYIITRSF